MFPGSLSAIPGNGFPVEFRIAGVKGSGDDLKFDRGHFLEIVEQMEQNKTVFTAGETDQNTVIFSDHLKASDGFSGKFSQFAGTVAVQRNQLLFPCDIGTGTDKENECFDKDFSKDKGDQFPFWVLEKAANKL